MVRSWRNLLEENKHLHQASSPAIGSEEADCIPSAGQFKLLCNLFHRKKNNCLLSRASNKRHRSSSSLLAGVQDFSPSFVQFELVFELVKSASDTKEANIFHADAFCASSVF